MLPGEETVRSLREALALSPDNVPLRRHLADTLRGLGRHGEAEVEYREAMARAPHDVELKLALAATYAEQGKDSHALVVLETLQARGEMSAHAHGLHARLLLRGGEGEAARAAYRAAVAADSAQRDAELERLLGVSRVVPQGSADEAGEAAAEDAPELLGEEREPAPARRVARGAARKRERVTFADVGGMDALKEEIELRILAPLKQPELFAAYGRAAGGGVLMYGPPGCGKTLLARATAGEVGARCLAVGIHEVLDMYLGQSERKLHELFEEARRSAPCVLFFDEVDALGAKRADMVGSAGRHVINQFLDELDGARGSNEGVLVLGATNAPWHLDAAFRRPGRFDRVLFVPPPDEPARAAILRILLQGKPQERFDCARLAKRTDGFSGADLRAVVDRAVEGKLRAALRSGTPAALREQDLLDALKQVRPSTREWFASARNHVLYANQGGLYDDVARYLDL